MKFICPLLFALLFHASPVSSQSKQLDSIFSLAVQYINAGDISNSTTHFLAAQQLAETEQNLKLLCRIHLGFGKIGLISENNNAVVEALMQAEKVCAACKDTVGLARGFMQKGILRIKENKMEEAMAAMLSCLDLYTQIRDTSGAMNAQAKIGNVLEVQGRYAEATPYYQNYYDYTIKSPESPDHLTANIYLAGHYIYLQEYEKATFHNNKVKAVAQKLEAKFEYAQSLRYEALILNKMGDHAAAFASLDGYLHYYQDTLMNEERLKENEALKAQFEAEKKEAQIALQTEQIKQERLRFWATLTGLVLALGLGAVLFFLMKRLRKRNEEKEFLIKEIHHRVKNNLQILSSLLHLQSRQISDDTALSAVREGQNRVDAMGLIHQKLYMGDRIAKVEMKDYLEQFGQNMLDSFGIEDGRVQLEYALQPMYLDVDTAIPLGLIINELVTNSFKYAFPNGNTGTVRIALWKNEENHLCLRVSDNGVGRANALKDEKSTAFGTNLVQILSKKLKGTPEILDQEQGYSTQIVFEKWG